MIIDQTDIYSMGWKRGRHFHKSPPQLTNVLFKAIKPVYFIHVQELTRGS